MKVGSSHIINGNALNLPLSDSSVDLIVTSPPYFALRSYSDGGGHYKGQIGDEPTPNEFVEALLKATEEMMRVLRSSGSIFVNLGDTYIGTGDKGEFVDPKNPKGRNGQAVSKNRKVAGFKRKSLVGVPWRYALRCIDDLGLILRAEIIWMKPNAMPSSVTDRVKRSHEQWFHFTKSPSYFSNTDAIREPYLSAPMKAQESKYIEYGQSTNQALATQSDLQHNPLGKLPCSVWTIATEPLKVDPALGIDHFAAFPSEWPRRIILGWSPPDGVVLDPFSGTGTTAGVAKALGRTGIGVDMSADYCRLAEWRTNGDGFEKLERKVLERTFGSTILQSKSMTEADHPQLFGDAA